MCVAVTCTPGNAPPTASVTRPESDAAANTMRGNATVKKTIRHTTPRIPHRAIRCLLGVAGMEGDAGACARAGLRSIRGGKAGTYLAADAAENRAPGGRSLRNQ